MSIEEFHRSLRAELQAVVAERLSSDEGSFPSEELIYAELAMDQIANANICESPTVCHWTGTIGNARLRITGYAQSADETCLDLFVTRYFGTEEIEALRDSEAASTAKEGIKFLFEAASGRLGAKIEKSGEIYELVLFIREQWASLQQLRVFVVTDGLTKSKRFAPKEVQGKIVAIEAMDIERLYRHTSGKPREEVSISFEQTLGRPLPCIHVPDPDADYEYALTAIPGEIIRELYLRYGPRLLEANVRTFLGYRSKVNQGIADTLLREPEHFMAFNNGLVMVCDSAQLSRCEDGGLGFSLMSGLQIVNGGQTTSSIFFASRDRKDIDLSHVMVPAKIIILKGDDDDARERLIANISRFANSQNAVKTSDLSANRPFHVQLEKLSEEVWCADGASRWFYERAAGAYQVRLLRERTDAKRREFQRMVPTRHKLSKNDIAKFHEAWRAKPAQVALAGEKNFAAFMSALDDNPELVPTPLTPEWYRAMIAKVIIFRAIEGAIKKKEAKEVFRQGWVNIATYTVAALSEKLPGRIHFEMVWQQQGISDRFAHLLWEWAKIVNATFERIAPGRQFSEVAKRADTWKAIRTATFPELPEGIPEIEES
ncbi:AIPR family protein [Sphingobium limneticum]|uniref:AIPR family protein n=1 Tax=Sphingobium limneticum TaxID=1007511 RepID=A0A5J5I1V2_9SPHN|nr:AIPR family protein [Sphingobium limneticum]KAA9016881.1 AIPR family protein [Sphingobium limneticum]KAA9029860.1 AIPR family protein [Sphingobium limneticum]